MIKILAIDFNKDNLLLLTIYLSGTFPNAKVIPLQSGIDGIDLVREENPDVILIEVFMPVMNGIETCKIIKEDNFLKLIPIIMILDTQTETAIHTKGLNPEAEVLLTRPIDETELTIQINSIIGKKGLGKHVHRELFQFNEDLSEWSKAMEESKCATLDLLEDLKTEIEHHKLLKEELLQSKEQFRNLFQDTPVGLYRTTPDGKILLANRAIYKILGFSNFEKLSVKDLQKCGFEPSYRREQFIEQIKKYGIVEDLESKWICYNGEIIIVRENAKVICDPAGKPLYYDGTVEDITERKRAEEALLESEVRFSSLAESAKEAIITINSKGIILGWNSGAEKIFGYTREETAEKNLTLIIPERYVESHIKGIERINQGGEQHIIGKTIELFGLHKNGKEFPVELSLAEWKTASGIFFMGIIRNITERKKAEHELIKAKEKAEESDRLKSAFLSNMSHEIRTPMNGILGFVDLLQDPEISKIKQKEYFKIITKSGERLITTINNIIEISKIEAGQSTIHYSNVNINHIMIFQFEFFSKEADNKGIELSFSIDNNVDEIIKTDKNKLYSILTNLIKNALKFTAKGGIEFGLKLADKKLEFFVKDSGGGIPADRIKEIFNRFEQAENGISRGYEGSGLGLSISKAYVEMLGGEIWVESELNKGSNFYFSIEYNQVSQTVKADDSNVVPFVHKKEMTRKTILVAEDDEAS